jgi:thioredoxin-related protein
MNGKIKAVSLALGIALVAGIVAVAATPSPVEGPSLPTVQWGSLDQAMHTAKAQKKAVFVMVYADWCGYCHKMEASTFRDPQIVAKMNAAFVPVKVNGESPKVLKLEKGDISESEWAMRQGVQGFPSLIVVDAKGRTVVMYPGYLTTPQTSRFLADVGDFLRAGGIDKLGNFLDWAQQRG